MGLTREKLGRFVSLSNERVGIPNLTAEQVSGVNRDKEFFEPTTQVGADTSAYKVVPPGYFACNLMHVGRDCVLPIAMNHSDQNKVVSPAYSVFSFNGGNVILADYFFLFLKSDERDRYFWFNTDSSVRDGMSWEDFCGLEIDIPPLEIQRKYVEVYQAAQLNQAQYDRGISDLYTICIAYIENLRRTTPCRPIGEFIEKSIEKNTDGRITLEQGINIDKQFITPQRSNSNLLGRQIVRTGQFAYCTQLNNQNVAIAYRTGPDCVVSSVYDVFYITDESKLLPEYLMLWLIRSEFGRFVYWASEGSAYEFLSYENLSNYLIPVPAIDVQRAVANVYKAYLSRKEISKRLKAVLHNLAPVLIKGAIDEGSR